MKTCATHSGSGSSGKTGNGGNGNGASAGNGKRNGNVNGNCGQGCKFCIFGQPGCEPKKIQEPKTQEEREKKMKK